MIARCGERRGQARKQSPARMAYQRGLAMHDGLCGADDAAIGLADGLVTKADAKDRQISRCLRQQIQAHAGFVGRAWSRRKNDRARPAGEHIGRAQRIVAQHFGLGAFPFEIVDEVEREAVEIVDDKDHDGALTRSARLLQRRGTKRGPCVRFRQIPHPDHCRAPRRRRPGHTSLRL